MTIIVENAANRDSSTFKHKVERLQTELRYIEGQRDLLRDQFIQILRELVFRGGQTIIGKFTHSEMIESSMEG